MMTMQLKISKRDTARDYLLQELRSGKYPAGTKFLSENDLIRELGISKNTVREAISSLVSDGFLFRIQGSGTYVKETESKVTRQLTLIIANPHRTGTRDIFIGSILSGLHDVMDSNGWQIRMKTFEPIADAGRAVEEFIAESPAGSSAVLAGFDFKRELTDRILASGRQVFTFGLPADPEVPYVHSDHTSGMRRALNHFLDHGHRRIALIDRRSSHTPSFEERREAYLACLGERGILPDARLMVEYEGFGTKAGEVAAEKLLARNVPFTAALVYGDWPCLGVRRGLERAGLRVPEEVSMICYADLNDTMTKVIIPYARMARELADLILAVSSGERPHGRLVETELIPGDTVINISKSAKEKVI